MKTHVKSLFLLLATALFALTIPALPAEPAAVPIAAAPSDRLFKRGELQFDAFAGYASVQAGALSTSLGSIATGGVYRGGVGINYFLTDNWGVGVDTILGSGGAGYFQTAALSGIFRFPVEKYRLAPYIFGGAGMVFQGPNYYTYHAGLGLEVRVTKRLGVFTDLRYTFSEGSNPDGTLVRLGARLNF